MSGLRGTLCNGKVEWICLNTTMLYTGKMDWKLEHKDIRGYFSAFGDDVNKDRHQESTKFLVLDDELLYPRNIVDEMFASSELVFDSRDLPSIKEYCKTSVPEKAQEV